MVQQVKQGEYVMYRYILFDLDGTLTDSGEGITKAVQYALHAQGIEEPDIHKLLLLFYLLSLPLVFP